jgi:zinc/manganese transport system substrate-binding protein
VTHLGGELHGDSLGPAGSDGYVSSEVHDADAVVRGSTGGARGCRIGLR